jgi:hypothetical protein
VTIAAGAVTLLSASVAFVPPQTIRPSPPLAVMLRRALPRVSFTDT